MQSSFYLKAQGHLLDWYPCLVVVHLRDSLTSCDLVETLHKLVLLCCECISKKKIKNSRTVFKILQKYKTISS
jgi:hypothetical protein